MLFGRQAHKHCMKKKEREMRKNKKKSFNFQSIIKVVIIRTEKQGSQKEDNLIILDCDLIRTYLEGRQWKKMNSKWNK